MLKKKKITKVVLRKRERRLQKRKDKELWMKLREDVINSQDNRCYLCTNKMSDKKNTIDIHHIIDRRFKPLTYDKLNLVGLCKRCHRLSIYAVHQSSIIFSDRLRNKEPERYSYLLKKIEELKNCRLCNATFVIEFSEQQYCKECSQYKDGRKKKKRSN